MRATAFLAMAVLLAANAVGATPSVANAPAVQKAVPRTAHVAPAPKRVLTVRTRTSAAERARVVTAEAWAEPLLPVEVMNRNTNASEKIRLYDDQGALDRGHARAFMRVAGSMKSTPDDTSDDDERLDLRVVQLAIRASYHFAAPNGTPPAIKIISATRPGARGRHGTGEALDFSLEGVNAAALAAYLRTTPRAGVGIYTHPKTQYVHLDVRDHSYHWIDGSPPGVTWREQLLADPKQATRDASWSASLDLPESR